MKERMRYIDTPMQGLGILKCNACGDPIRDHEKIRPCPTLGVNVIRVSDIGAPRGPQARSRR